MGTSLITWARLTGLVDGNRSLTKVDGTDDWNSGAFSNESIGSDGALQFIIETLGDMIVGLSETDPLDNFSLANTAMFMNPDGSWQVIEPLGSSGPLGFLKLGDAVKVQRIAGVIYWYVNGVLKYTSPTENTNALFVYAEFNEVGRRISHMALFHGIKAVDPNTCTIFFFLRSPSNNPIVGAQVSFKPVTRSSQYLEASDYVICGPAQVVTTGDLGYGFIDLIWSSQYEGASPLKYLVTITLPDKSTIQYLDPVARSPLLIIVPDEDTKDLTDLLTALTTP